MIYNTINQYLEPRMQENRDKIAIYYPEKGLCYTYEEMDTKITKIAKSLLAMGARKQEHIAIILPTCPEWIFFFLGITKIGAIPVCLNDSDLESDMLYKLNHSDTTYLVTTEEMYQRLVRDEPSLKGKKVILLDAISPVGEETIAYPAFLAQADGVSENQLQQAVNATRFDDVLNIQYTSGTTGNPKAVLSLHYRVLSNVKVFLDNFGYTAEDRILSALPLYHVMGCLFTGILAFMTGASLVLVSKFKTKMVLQTIEDIGCTSFHGVPTMYRFMLNYVADYKITSLHKAMIAGDYCSPALVDEIRDNLHIEYVFPCFGQSEGIGLTQVLTTDPLDKVKHTVGKAVEGVVLEIIDEKGNTLPVGEVGEVIAFVPYQMKGYYKDEIATRKTIKEGWIHTGDLGYLDEDGYLVMKGRKKDIIIRGGENISPVEIENILAKHEAIEHVAVVGVPDELMGEEIAAFVSVGEEHKLKEAQVREHLTYYMEHNLPRYERPKFIYFVDRFPMTQSGKIQKRKLVETLRKEA